MGDAKTEAETETEKETRVRMNRRMRKRKRVRIKTGMFDCRSKGHQAVSFPRPRNPRKEKMGIGWIWLNIVIRMSLNRIDDGKSKI